MVGQRNGRTSYHPGLGKRAHEEQVTSDKGSPYGPRNPARGTLTTAPPPPPRTRRVEETWRRLGGQLTLRRVRFVIETRDTTLSTHRKEAEIEGRPSPPPVKRRSINPPPPRARLPERKYNPSRMFLALYTATEREYAKFLDPVRTVIQSVNSDPKPAHPKRSLNEKVTKSLRKKKTIREREK